MVSGESGGCCLSDTIQSHKLKLYACGLNLKVNMEFALTAGLSSAGVGGGLQILGGFKSEQFNSAYLACML